MTHLRVINGLKKEGKPRTKVNYDVVPFLLEESISEVKPQPHGIIHESVHHVIEGLINTSDLRRAKQKIMQLSHNAGLLAESIKNK